MELLINPREQARGAVLEGVAKSLRLRRLLHIIPTLTVPVSVELGQASLVPRGENDAEGFQEDEGVLPRIWWASKRHVEVGGFDVLGEEATHDP